MTTTPSLHPLLLLSDSALPLGSFAFSSGLESFLSHKNLSSLHSHSTTAATKLAAFNTFLSESLANIASTSLPYVLSAYHHPTRLEELDNDFDASTPCTVARRASMTQGKAMLEVWGRALASNATAGMDATSEMNAFAAKVKTNATDAFGMQLQAHFAPLFGAVCAALGLKEYETAYLFLLNHAKAVLSAGVRASVMGPYQSQAVLASGKLQAGISGCIEKWKRNDRKYDHAEAVVTIPTMDLWMGRHELLYSRIFNS